MFNTKIPIYSIMILLALLANIIVVLLNYKKYNFNRREIISLLLYENVGIIFGAKVLDFLQNFKKLNGKFDFISLGLASYGAVIGALVFLLIFCWQFKKSFKEILYIFLPSIPLMYAIGKIGCFLVGCCYGIEYEGFGSIIYKYSSSAPKNISLFPVQIIETFVFFGIFIFLIIKYKEGFNLQSIGISLILSSAAKFILDFFRASHVGQILSLNQIISTLFFIIGLIVISLPKKNKQIERN